MLVNGTDWFVTCLMVLTGGMSYVRRAWTRWQE